MSFVKQEQQPFEAHVDKYFAGMAFALALAGSYSPAKVEAQGTKPPIVSKGHDSRKQGGDPIPGDWYAEVKGGQYNFSADQIKSLNSQYPTLEAAMQFWNEKGAMSGGVVGVNIFASAPESGFALMGLRVKDEKNGGELIMLPALHMGDRGLEYRTEPTTLDNTYILEADPTKFVISPIEKSGKFTLRRININSFGSVDVLQDVDGIVDWTRVDAPSDELFKVEQFKQLVESLPLSEVPAHFGPVSVKSDGDLFQADIFNQEFGELFAYNILLKDMVLQKSGKKLDPARERSQINQLAALAKNSPIAIDLPLEESIEATTGASKVIADKTARWNTEKGLVVHITDIDQPDGVWLHKPEAYGSQKANTVVMKQFGWKIDKGALTLVVSANYLAEKKQVYQDFLSKQYQGEELKNMLNNAMSQELTGLFSDAGYLLTNKKVMSNKTWIDQEPAEPAFNEMSDMKTFVVSPLLGGGPVFKNQQFGNRYSLFELVNR